MSIKGVQSFERSRIKALQEERVGIQKKTFTKWANAFLERARFQILDLFTDLADGKILMKLLEIISGERVGKPNKGILRVQKLENVNRCLTFLATKVHFENIGSEDIVDGNPRLILGLIWTIILRFQIQEIEELLDEDGEDSEKRSARDALLLWCQRKTAGYPGVKIENFTTSWRNGLGFNALIHAHRPDLIQYENLHPAEHIKNLNNAFTVARRDLEIPQILDAEDVDVNKPDEKVVMTYVASYYHYFAKMKTEMTGGKRIAKIMSLMMDVEGLQKDYEHMTTKLLEWIKKKIVQLGDKNFPNLLEGIQKELIKFKEYRTVEKPPKYQERGNIEAQYFNIQARLKANGQKGYLPPEGKLVHDIETAWSNLEKAEHDREVALRDELIRQERLERLAQRFVRKAAIRESWLGDMFIILDEKIECSNTAQTEAAIKKHEAISAEILARKDRLKTLNSLARELVRGNYHAKDTIKDRDKSIMVKWKNLVDKLDNRKSRLSKLDSLMGMFREIESIQDELKEVADKIKADYNSKHLQAAEDALHKHSLTETQLNALAKRVRNLNRRSRQYGESGHPEVTVLDKNLEDLNVELEKVTNMSKQRREALERDAQYFQFVQDAEEEDQWMQEKINVVKSSVAPKDLNSAQSMLKKHAAVEAEMQGHWPHTEQVCKNGEELLKAGYFKKQEIAPRIMSLKDKSRELMELAKVRKTRLEDSMEVQQYYADANDAESWMKEKMPLVCSDDYGRDEASAQALLSRHHRLHQEIKTFSNEVKRLDELAALMTKAANEHNLSPQKYTVPIQNGESSDGEEEEIDVPHEVEEEQVVEQEVMEDTLQSRKIPQVKAMYSYKGQDGKVDKGEVMVLMEKTNADWWQIEKKNGLECYVPASYVKEIEPKVVQKVVKKFVTVPKKVKVKKIVMKKEKVKKRKDASLRKTPSIRFKDNLHFDKDNVERCQHNINLTYDKLRKLAQTRQIGLEDAKRLFRFYRECDEFEAWMIEKEQLLRNKESLADNIEAVKKKFENLLTSFAANKSCLDSINKLANEIVKSGSSQKNKVIKRQKEINDRWENLNKCKLDKEKSLKGASSIEMYKSTCDELQEWMKEKNNAFYSDEVGKDLKTIKDLQRKHMNLERELVPVEEKIKRMNFLADTVKSAYPDEKGYVDNRQKDLHNQWKALQERSRNRRQQLSDAKDRQKFTDDAKELLSWAGTLKAKMASSELPRDPQTAKRLLKEHGDLGDEIKAKKDRFRELQQLGKKIPGSQETLQKLQDEEKAVDSMWLTRNKKLEDAHKLQIFNKDADYIDSVTSSHEAFLEFVPNVNNLDDVQRQMRRHEEFISTLDAQDEKVSGLNAMADKLISCKHPESKHIDDRRNQVTARRQQVKDKAADRLKSMQGSENLQEFKRDAEELSDWMKEKCKTATEESYRDLSNLPAKLQQHQAFEAELKANNKRLEQINKDGQTLMASQPLCSSEVKNILGELKQQWHNLYAKSSDKGNRLRQAVQQRELDRALENANAKLDEMEKSISSEDIGSDLRSCKDLLLKHQILENDLVSLAKNVESITLQSEAMAQADHFNKAGIVAAVDKFNKRFKKLKPSVVQRKQKLQDSLKWHQFNFDVDNELQWIKERVHVASSTDYGKSLVDAQNLKKKHEKFKLEIQGHQPIQERILTTGYNLIKENHFASKAVKDRCQDLQLSWDDLLSKSKYRKKNLDLSLQTQKYLSEVSEIEAWINEKMAIAQSTDYGKDENAADRLLAKNKVLEADIQTYQGIVNSLSKEATRLIKIGNSDPGSIRRTQDNLFDKMNKLKRCATERRNALEHSKKLHSYFRESEDFENWINMQMQTACAEEYGQDYEHLELLQTKFDEFKWDIEAGTERYNRCERLANQLIESKGPHVEDVKNRHKHLQDAWLLLLEQIEARDHKLLGAGDIHRFNRDVAEALGRIQEKASAIPDDLGRNLTATQSYLKKHEGFENDLMALEAQLQVLMDDAGRLQKVYSGELTDQIEESKNEVLKNWSILQERAEQRKDELLATAEMHRFRASVRELLSWAHETKAEMVAEVQVRDVHGVVLLQTRHDQLKAEIEARNDTFSSVVQTGRNMIKNGHYAKDEIKEKVDKILDFQEKLQQLWQDCKDYFDQLHNLHLFLRDANQLNRISTSQEASLNSTDFGSTVEQVEALMRKHEAFEKVVAAQEEKLEAVKVQGNNLVKQKHFASNNVQNELDNLIKKRSKINDQCSQRYKTLSDSLLYNQFRQDVVEMESWIDDKLKVTSDENFKDATDLYDKMKKLQKHQAFEAEIVANKERIDKIKEKGGILIEKKYPASEEIKRCVQRLLKKWQELLQASAKRGKGLEEARDILQFNEQVEKVKMWIREKEMLVNAGELGRDYEHCLELQKKANDLESAGITVDESRVKYINSLAEKLITQGQLDTRAVKQKLDDMNKKWKDLQGALNDYKGRLAVAAEVHAFNRDVDDFNERINEKAIQLSADDFGKSLSAVQALQRKQEETERDLTALEKQLDKIEKQGSTLCRKYPDMASSIGQKQKEAKENWDKLQDLSNTRKHKLAASYQLQKFLSDGRELVSWSTDMINRMNARELAKDVIEAENMLQMHHERQAEINGRQAHFLAVREQGLNLVNGNHYASDEIQKLVKELEQTRLLLIGSWDKRSKLLTQCHDLQVFKETAEQADSWLASKEAILANEDLGNTLYTVEALLKKHTGFEKALRAQEDRIDDVSQFASDLCSNQHYATDEIQSRCKAVLTRREQLWNSSSARRHKLLDSRKYQLFLRNLFEVSGWINEKVQIALEESYRDPTNLQAKLQKHQAFELELTANRNRVDSVVKEGEGLINADHYSKANIKKNLQELELDWKALMSASAEKKEKLQDAYQALTFNRIVDDLHSWMDDVENQLVSEDHGKDLVSANTILKKHLQLEQDIANHQERVQDVIGTAQVFKEAKHFLGKELQNRARKTSERYNLLKEPCNIRRENLQEALLMFTFYRDVEDEMSWIKEKHPIAESTDLGKSLTAVQNLIKKHQALESEIIAHEPQIEGVANVAQHMIKNKHFASQEIQVRLDDLHNQLQQLKELTSARKLKLQDSMEAQKFYSEVTEAESWMNEKIPLLTSSDLGRDEDSVQGLIKKLDAQERDIDNFSNNIGELAALKRNLVDRGHYDVKNIKKQQDSIEKKYSTLQDLVVQRRAKLNDSKKLFEFFREVDEVADWINEKEAIAAADDCGQDLEHVEILQQKFEDFVYELSTSEDKITGINVMAKSMVDSGHFEVDEIKHRAAEINQMWKELRNATKLRQESLDSAKQIHMYGRDTDDALEWIQEKEGLVTSDNYGQDLESVQALLSRHDGLERDLAAISEQVETITKEANRLVDQFPDAQKHVASKHEMMVQSWNNLVEKATVRKEKLQQAEQLQTYFNDYRELVAWINEMMVLVSSEDLAKDVAGAESACSRIKELKAEIHNLQEMLSKFNQTGTALIENGHFLSEEIQQKIERLNGMYHHLLKILEQRKILYEQNLQAQLFLHEMDQLEAWINFREPLLKEGKFGDSIETAEELIRRHADFEKTVDAQEGKFNALHRHLQIEETFAKQKIQEQQQLVEDEAKQERDRLEEIKRKEQKRILEERKQEEEQRKAREIKPHWQAAKSSDSEDEGKAENEEIDKQLDKSMAKSVFGRSHSIKLKNKKPDHSSARRAFSFRSPLENSFKDKDNSDDSSSKFLVELGTLEVKAPEPVIPQKHGKMESSRKVAETELQIDKVDNIAEVTETDNRIDSTVVDGSPRQKGLELLKSEEKKARRAPSLNLKRRTRSFKEKYHLPSDLPEPIISGNLERKHEFQAGGKKATIRSWRTYYTALCGQWLCLFKDKEDFDEKIPAAPTLNVHNAICEIASDYTKRKNVLRLKLKDGAEFLFEAGSLNDMREWHEKVGFQAVQSPLTSDLELDISDDTEDFDSGGLESSEHASPERNVSPTLFEDRPMFSGVDKEIGSFDQISDKPNNKSIVSEHNQKGNLEQRDEVSYARNTSYTSAMNLQMAPGHKRDTSGSSQSDDDDVPMLPVSVPPLQFHKIEEKDETAASMQITSEKLDEDDFEEPLKMRPKPMPRSSPSVAAVSQHAATGRDSASSQRPFSESYLVQAGEFDKKPEKEKRKSMFGFFKKKKSEKEHHKEHRKDKW